MQADKLLKGCLVLLIVGAVLSLPFSIFVWRLTEGLTSDARAMVLAFGTAGLTVFVPIALMVLAGVGYLVYDRKQDRMERRDADARHRFPTIRMEPTYNPPGLPDFGEQPGFGGTGGGLTDYLPVAEDYDGM